MTGTLIRSALFVPGDRPERFSKALASGADAVIVDLEDAVAADAKEQARASLESFLVEQPESRIWVRVNATEHEAHVQDLALCRRQPGVIGVVLPKTERVAQITQAATCGKPVWPIIESARGVQQITEIAGSAGIERLVLGVVDLALDLGLIPYSEGGEFILNQARYACLMASRIAGLAPALDSVYPDFNDTAGLQRFIRRAQEMGFGGALCIHPRQVPVIHATLAPLDHELAWARKVVEAAAGQERGVFQLEGEMIDEPVLTHARRLLEAVGETSLAEPNAPS
ncbi:(S)-citramalyl-CoA lyase [Pseudomonas duriflava]|uniref:(S)-citramalyl-CoA lyase n=1 Tax=Pseudomonas duriflava TaxID=459528 RepID=A0A562Q9F9_9PSED|nr:CoA ester lyase [Pseudomonas duriflava]TWI53363.1 (S)-citramalyl-CoA lyase [Pseudomonas duriflava]